MRLVDTTLAPHLYIMHYMSLCGSNLVFFKRRFIQPEGRLVAARLPLAPVVEAPAEPRLVHRAQVGFLELLVIEGANLRVGIVGLP